MRPLSVMPSDFTNILLSWPRTSTRRMFGSDAFFVGDRMFAFLWEETVVAKLPEAEQEAAFASFHARPFTVGQGRPFGDWVEFAGAGAPPEELLPWLKRAYRHVQVTPPTGKRSPRKRRS